MQWLHVTERYPFSLSIIWNTSRPWNHSIPCKKWLTRGSAKPTPSMEHFSLLFWAVKRRLKKLLASQGSTLHPETIFEEIRMFQSHQYTGMVSQYWTFGDLSTIASCEQWLIYCRAKWWSKSHSPYNVLYMNALEWQISPIDLKYSIYHSLPSL